jgi:hypothetical protein
MAKRMIIVVWVVCFSITVLGVQRPSRTRPKLPPLKRGMTREEYSEEFKKSLEQHRQEELRKGQELMKLLFREAWQRLLLVTERQWALISPKYEEVNALSCEVGLGAPGWTGASKEKFRWHRRSKGTGGTRAKALDEMTEGEAIIEELTDLLEDENAKDEEIRRKIEALERVRNKARSALPKARRELAGVLTSARQEAVFVLLGSIE